MFGRFFQKQFRQQRCGHRRRECRMHALSDFAKGADVVVAANTDHKTLEMGLFSGVRVHVIKNRPADANMVIAVGESRYIIAKEAAHKIRVH